MHAAHPVRRFHSLYSVDTHGFAEELPLTRNSAFCLHHPTQAPGVLQWEEGGAGAVGGIAQSGQTLKQLARYNGERGKLRQLLNQHASWLQHLRHRMDSGAHGAAGKMPLQPFDLNIEAS